MSWFKEILPFVGQLLFIAVLAVVLLGRWIKSGRFRLGVVTAVVVLGMTVPVYSLSLAEWLRSVVGDLSVLTMLVLINILTQRLGRFDLLSATSRPYLFIAVALLGIVFYPLALGASEFDPYSMGYAPFTLVLVVCALSIIAWLGSQRKLAVMLLLPLLAFNLTLLESTNLWDYLLDPVLVIYAVVQVLIALKGIALHKTSKQISS